MAGKIHGHVEVAKGTVKETTGKVMGSQSLRVDGALQKAVGHAEAQAPTTANHVKGEVHPTNSKKETEKNSPV
ncbi:hypothetical protein HKX48_004457 [Thoreauomyces humboldtii]|nr:hypothetical protein HKX48_004457 [Thoreauomyces humboldtii]